jgi:excisionase family DNA binding protein
MTTGDVARSCHVTTNAVKKWIREKNLPAFKTPGGHFRIRAEDFEAFVQRYQMPVSAGSSRAVPKVLVVDDDADILNLVIMALTDPPLGLTAEGASDGYEALIAIGRMTPDLLVLDLKMPRVDGFEVCRQLKSKDATKGIAILVMTGFPSKIDIRKLKQWGVEEILTKPFAIPDLVSMVQRVLGDRIQPQGRVTQA